MTIALFSDIHANLPALHAFFADLEKHNVDAIYCLGDLVGYNTWPNEVVDEVKSRRISTIAGNYDFGIGRYSDDCGCAYKTDVEKANGAVSISFTNKIIGDGQRNFLRTLPAHIRLEFQLNDDKLKLLLVHGSPRKINEYLFEDREEGSLLRIMQDADADIMCFGHTHKPFHRMLKDTHYGIAKYRHAVNIGSIGKPKDNDPRGCYAILHINENSSAASYQSVDVNFHRFKYDVETAAKAIEASELPNDYATMLRSGS